MIDCYIYGRGSTLEGVTSGVKQWHDAGLPNITGSIGNTVEESGAYANGAFRVNYSKGPGGRGDRTDYGAYFNASWSNPIYGRSSTVQPASYTVYYIMRVR